MNKKIPGYGIIGLAVILLVLLILVKSDLDNRDVFLCEAVHSNPDVEMSECPAHKSNTSWILLIAFGVVFVILAGGIYMIVDSYRTKPQSVHTNEFKTVDLGRLNDEENKIYDLLKQHDGSMYQSDLIKATDFSKVQMTRLLDKMEHNHVIDRKRRGMTNIVVLR